MKLHLINEISAKLMKLSYIHESNKKFIKVYHSTNSIYSLRNIIKGKFRSLVSDFNSEIGNKRLSATTNVKDWPFGIYVLEILIKKDAHLTTEYVIYEDDYFKFLRWGINFGYPDVNIMWFKLNELNDFDLSKYEDKILSINNELAYESYIFDFLKGKIPEGSADKVSKYLKDTVVKFLDLANRKGIDYAEKNWGRFYRKELYSFKNNIIAWDDEFKVCDRDGNCTDEDLAYVDDENYWGNS